jgi:hypothetical protein
LEIGLYCVGQVVVNDHAHIGLVDTHTEGVGGDDDPDIGRRAAYRTLALRAMGY